MEKLDKKIKVGILGATGSVGQKFVELLLNHPWFEISVLAASERSAGKQYKEATNWIMSTILPEQIGKMVVTNCTPDKLLTEAGEKPELLFSGLDASVAGEIETKLAEAGFKIVSNARNHRFDKYVPLMIPEVNPEHLELIKKQDTSGAIVTNPNCSTIGMVMALKPLHEKFEIETVNVSTMQAISGGGYPGVPGMDILDNVVPYIGSEEEKMETEPLKILGKFSEEGIVETSMNISAQCNRVPVIDGHMECIQIKFKEKPSKEEIINAWKEFKSEPQKMNLPSAPENPVHYFTEERFPQPKTHRNLEKGMAVSVGRLRECSIFDYKFVVLSHNTIRGAAGGTILVAELMKAKELL